MALDTEENLPLLRQVEVEENEGGHEFGSRKEEGRDLYFLNQGIRELMRCKTLASDLKKSDRSLEQLLWGMRKREERRQVQSLLSRFEDFTELGECVFLKYTN